MIDQAAVEQDLRRAIARWTAKRPASGWDGPLARDPGEAPRWAAQAIDVMGSAPGGPAEEPRLAIVTKHPHGGSDTAAAAIVARALALGARVHSVHRLGDEDADRVAQALYLSTWQGFHGKLSRSLRQAVAARFDVPEFREVFGVPFDDALIRPGAQLVADGVPPDLLISIWAEGRSPIERATFAERHGVKAAAMIAGDEPSIDWFQNGRWPIGIQRIRSGLMAFALRHPLLGDSPVIVLNGHYPDLAGLFRHRGQGCVVIELGVDPDSPIDVLRSWLVGASNDPRRCSPGSIRGDAAAGEFPAATNDPPSPRANVLHCSDGLLAGEIDLHRLLGTTSGGLAHALLRGGYDADDIELIREDPLVKAARNTWRLSQWTRGQRLADCMAFLERVCPPVFGQANGFADGFPPRRFRAASQTLFEAAGEWPATEPAPRYQPIPAPPHVQSLDPLEESGLAVIARGELALLVPAGGTGGRFGGYDVPESDPRRQKPLIPLFSLQGDLRSCLDIRLANARYWTERTGAPVRVALMAAPTNRDTVRGWAAGAAAFGADLAVFEQHGLPRFRAEVLASGDQEHDPVARNPDGSPDLKPCGSIGVFTAFALSGCMDAWERDGVRFLALANADDVGARIQPTVLGWMEQNPDLDAVVLSVPRGFVSTAEDGSIVRGDVSGWRAPVQEPPDRTGTAPAGSVMELGGAVLWQLQGARRKVVVAERHSEPSPWFNTNQIFVRLAALKRALLGDGGDPVESVRASLEPLPLFAERKETPKGDRVVQFFQPAADILRLFDDVRVLSLSRWPSAGQRGAFAPLKERRDVPHSQQLLALLAEAGDELAFSPGPL